MSVKSTVQAAHRSVTTLLVATTAPVMWALILMLTITPAMVSFLTTYKSTNLTTNINNKSEAFFLIPCRHQ